MTTPRTNDTRTHTGSATWVLAVTLFAFVFGGYMLTYSRTFDVPADEGNMFLVTESLVKFGRTSIEQGDNVQYISQADLGPDGSRYAKYGIGQPLAAAPLYALGLVTPALGLVDMVLLLNPLVSALATVVLMLSALELGAGRGRALAIALIYAFCTAAWVYAKGFPSEPLVGLGYALACWGVAILLRRERPTGALLAGAGLGLAMLVKSSEAIAAPVLLLVIWRYGRAWRLPRWRYLLAAAALVALAALAIALYNWLRFGNPLITGYGSETFSVLPWIGAAGMLFAPGRSLFIYAPVMLAAVPGLWLLRKPAGLRAWLICTVLAVLLLHGAWWSWWGAWSWGPRYLVPVLPLLALGLLGVLGLQPEAYRVSAPPGDESHMPQQNEATPSAAPATTRASHGAPVSEPGAMADAAPARGAVLRSRIVAVAVAALAVLGFLLQVPGVSVYRAYFFWDVMKYFPKSNPDEVSLYTFRFFMPLTNLREALGGNLDFAWKQGLKAPLDLTALLLAAAGFLIGAAGLALAWRGGRTGRLSAVVSLLLVLAIAAGSLVYYQRRDNNPFNALAPAIEKLVPPGSVLLLGDRTPDTIRLLWNANRSLRPIDGVPGDPYWMNRRALPLVRQTISSGHQLWYVQTEKEPPAALWAALGKSGQCSTAYPVNAQLTLVRWAPCAGSDTAGIAFP